MLPKVLPVRGGVFLDARGGERALRVNWHHDEGLVVLSLWRGGACVGTVRLRPHEVPALIAALSSELAEGYAADSAQPLQAL